MELQERIKILTQGAVIAQKNGVLTLAEASLAKQAIDALNNNVSHKEAFEILIKIVLNGQKKGIYTLRDAYFLYLASERIDDVLADIGKPQVQEQEEKMGKSNERKNKKESE